MRGVVFLALLGLAVGIPPTQKGVSNDDIRNAILSMVHTMRSIEDKLERHEFRERAVAEQMRRNHSALDKRLKVFEPIRGTIGRLDERLANVETILMQSDKKEQAEIQKIVDSLDALTKSLPGIIENLKTEIIKVVTKPQAPIDLSVIEKKINESVTNFSKSTGNIQEELVKIQKDNEKFMNNIEKSTENFDRVKKQLSSSELLLAKYDTKLNELNNKIPTEFVPLNYKEQQDWQTSFMKVLEQQKEKVTKIAEKLNEMSDRTAALPQVSHLVKLENATLELLEEIKYETEQQTNKNSLILNDKLKQLSDDSDKKHEDFMKSVTDLTEMTEGLTENLANSYDQLKTDMSALSKVEQVMVQTADGVLDTKRRVEYGVHQIILEVGNLVKEYGEKINGTIHERFDTFELSVLDGESGALANLTSKIGQEIDQVWRQIGIMHQQMSASTDTLNKLQNQTDVYVNGSLNAMDSMKGKVGQITTRMNEVDDNLNHLMGRLSLVTQEFNRIKTGLSKALDEIKGSFAAVQDKIKDVGPGPHQIPNSEENDTSSVLN